MQWRPEKLQWRRNHKNSQFSSLLLKAIYSMTICQEVVEVIEQIRNLRKQMLLMISNQKIVVRLKWKSLMEMHHNMICKAKALKILILRELIKQLWVEEVEDKTLLTTSLTQALLELMTLNLWEVWKVDFLKLLLEELTVVVQCIAVNQALYYNGSLKLEEVSNPHRDQDLTSKRSLLSMD